MNTLGWLAIAAGLGAVCWVAGYLLGQKRGFDSGWLKHNDHREELLARERKRRNPIGRFAAKEARTS